MWQYYSDAVNSFWTVHEVSVVQDPADYRKLSPQMQHCVKRILAFFAASDNIVNVNIMERFLNDVKIYEAQRFYNMQVAMEDIHAHMYSILLDAIVPDVEEKNSLYNAMNTIPVIGKMTAYMYEIIHSDCTFSERVLKMACVEGIFFTSCFCIIYWIQMQQLMPGLGQSNELIARDEMLHATFALELYMLTERLPTDKVHQIFDDAVAIAIEFARDAIQDGIPEMNINLMIPYIQCCADNMITMIDQPPLYNTTHEFSFMEKINLEGRTNFFERRVSEYGKTQDASARGAVDEDF